MKISVVTPAFNASSTIMSNIRSVLDQSHDDWEHVIVDDGSMDDTARLAVLDRGRTSQAVPGRSRRSVLRPKPWRGRGER